MRTEWISLTVSVVALICTFVFSVLNMTEAASSRARTFAGSLRIMGSKVVPILAVLSAGTGIAVIFLFGSDPLSRVEVFVLVIQSSVLAALPGIHSVARLRRELSEGRE